MPAPKEAGKTPVARGIKFVKKANMWLFYKTFNIENTPDKMLWFGTEEEAKQAYKDDFSEQRG